ncbi:hypothetical protein KQX54_007350 [Cotesia glomerata]|uniref:Uncharacterized protein n=1 Tax=Cotesia glomerata TaxID=32391 RepID=A0AAV7I4U4_COTGL|nr:hypothetical protein KQX54_007350 [Cotesia glomerata]
MYYALRSRYRGSRRKNTSLCPRRHSVVGSKPWIVDPTIISTIVLPKEKRDSYIQYICFRILYFTFRCIVPFTPVSFRQWRAKGALTCRHNPPANERPGTRTLLYEVYEVYPVYGLSPTPNGQRLNRDPKTKLVDPTIPIQLEHY